MKQKRMQPFGITLMMLVHHDEAKREYAYGAESKIGAFNDGLWLRRRRKAKSSSA